MRIELVPNASFRTVFVLLNDTSCLQSVPNFVCKKPGLSRMHLEPVIYDLGKRRPVPNPYCCFVQKNYCPQLVLDQYRCMGNGLATQLRRADYLPLTVPQRVLLVSVADAASKYQRLLGRSAFCAVEMPATDPQTDVQRRTACTANLSVAELLWMHTVCTCAYLSQEVKCFHQADVYGHTQVQHAHDVLPT